MAEPLIIPAALRPWLKSGLSALLLENPERVEALRAIPTLPAAPSGQAKAIRPTATPNATPPAAPSPSPSPSGDAPRNVGGSPYVPPQKNTAPPTARQTEAPAPKAASPSASSLILPLAEWPAPWKALKNRRPLPPRPLVFWTYAGLGDDLMGTADPERQQAIVQLLTALRHPGGTHVFWPYALPDAPLSVDGPSLFWSGVELLKPRVILVFGSEARDALGLPKSLVPFSQDRVEGRMIVQLHQPASLVASQEDDPLRRAIAFLSRLLSFCAPR